MAIVVLQHSPTAGAMRLGATLRDYGHRLRVIELYAGAPVPRDLDDTDGVISTGGHMSANESHDWLEPEMDLLRRADDADLPVIGLCLGCQVLSRALGGEVGSVEGGIELGWHEVALTPAGAEDPVHAGIAWTSMQLHWHREQVTVPPQGARVLATSQRCPVQTWTRGMRTYGFQYHVESEIDTIETWAREHPEDLVEAAVGIEELRAQTAAQFDSYARLTGRLFESIALLLVPADKRYQGVVRDLHH